MLASAGVLLLMYMIVILMLAMSVKDNRRLEKLPSLLRDY